jgi:Leucine-rich repeat (LRR) protein
VLRSLTWLRIANCALTQLPEELGALANLEVLELSGNKSLTALPAGVLGKLGKLRKLVVEGAAIAKLPRI